MIYQVGKKQCSISGRKQHDIAPLESDFMVQPSSLLEFPGPLTPPPPWNFQFPPWWRSGYFLEPHNKAGGCSSNNLRNLTPFIIGGRLQITPLLAGLLTYTVGLGKQLREFTVW